MVDLLHLEENREEYGEDGVDLGETLRAGTSAAAGLHLTLHYNSNMAFSSRYSVFSAARQALGGQHCRATALAIQEQNTDTTGGGFVLVAFSIDFSILLIS
jgi:NaMN:DMB phosphoribosyltransferase